ncbi:hypothetical protein [Thermosynechococcus vestitus]|uniref:Tlr0198 protein n=1 Tax=Thermosynechococcus vestitus (strain NIES-2133 / IAM M-273 / BP-1) TaxID=197221 RepID=Q8DMC3_THEVB|nr:hypothetical protein [Thermosynechococcus vestitus]BAC07751.1 tlr0198 [Thermosynechococcus vestitus BP-1]BAY51922.1 hypothetical protein NIES2134_104810 [Thermostichus vulcanus NIES-2134]
MAHPLQKIPAIAWEAAAKIAVHLVLLVFGLGAIAKLVPYQRSQLQKLHALEAEVAQLEARVKELQREQERDRQPQARRRIAQEEANLIGANQRRIIWVQPNTSKQEPD